MCLNGQPIPGPRLCRKWRYVLPLKNPADHKVPLQTHSQMITLYGTGGELHPKDLARCMMDTYRAMNKHYIPTGYELGSFAKYLVTKPEYSIVVARE